MEIEPKRSAPLFAEEPKKKHYTSVSSLKTWRKCSLQWKYTKFDKVQYQPAAWLAQGSAFGKAAEEWELAYRKMDQGQLTDIYLGSYSEEILRYKEKTPNLRDWLVMGRTTVEKDIETRRQRGLDQLLRYVERVLEEPWSIWELPDGRPGVEIGFDLDLGFGPIKGYVDLCKQWEDGSITVCDLKTGNREDTILQLKVYQLALNELFSLDITHGSYYYAKDDTYSDLVDLNASMDLAYVQSQFEAMQRGIEARAFIANPGSGCALCAARNQCPEYRTI